MGSPTLSLPTDGWSLTGRLEMGTDGLVSLVDGRIEQKQRGLVAARSAGPRR